MALNHLIESRLSIVMYQYAGVDCSEIASLDVNIDNMVNRGKDDRILLVDVSETNPDKIAAIVEQQVK